MRLELTDIRSIVSLVVNELTNEAAQKNVQIKVIIGGTIPEFYIDPDHFRAIITNLLNNAIKYCYPHTIIEINLDHSDHEVAISIRDQGMSIPEEDREKIFTKFFRASNAVLGETEGSGLGLFVVKSYVEELGGKVDFISEEGVGTEFRVKLPLRSESVAESAQAK